MKKSTIMGLASVLILILIFKSDAFQEKFFPERFYINKVDELEESLKEAEKEIYLCYTLYENAKRDAQKDYIEELEYLRKVAPDEDFESLKAQASKWVAVNISASFKVLQDAINRRNDIHRELQEVKKSLAQFKSSNH